MRILLVEDDALLGDALQVGLRQADHVVDWVRDGVSAETALATRTTRPWSSISACRGWTAWTCCATCGEEEDPAGTDPHRP